MQIGHRERRATKVAKFDDELKLRIRLANDNFDDNFDDNFESKFRRRIRIELREVEFDDRFREVE